MFNLKKDINSDINEIENKVGKLLPFLVAHITVLLDLEKGLLATLQSTSPLILSAILPPEIVNAIPTIETLLIKAIQDTLKGSAIITDVNNAITLQTKLQVLLTDLTTTPNLAKGIIRTIMLDVLANLNNNALSAAEYEIYLQIKEYLGS